MNIYRSASQLVGHTPLLQPVRYSQQLQLHATVLVKLEYFNPAGSVKDRVALEMIETAEKDGKLLPGGTIVEPTSGNTGIGLAAMGIARGYKVILTMPESMSVERRQMLAAYGAQVQLHIAKVFFVDMCKLGQFLTSSSIRRGNVVNLTWKFKR